jgi:serine/threonine protein kinase
MKWCLPTWRTAKNHKSKGGKDKEDPLLVAKRAQAKQAALSSPETAGNLAGKSSAETRVPEHGAERGKMNYMSTDVEEASLGLGGSFSASMMGVEEGTSSSSSTTQGSVGGTAVDRFVYDSQGRLMLGHYIVGPELGKGAQGTVRLGEDSQTGEKVALKLIAFKSAVKLDRQRAHVEAEVNAMSAVPHPNVIGLRCFLPRVHVPPTGFSHREGQSDGGVTDTESSGEDGLSQGPMAGKYVMVLILELAPGGELLPLLLHCGALEERIARTYFIQMASALVACHSKGIFHRDIKPENLLLDGKFQLKVADFGLSALREHARSDGDSPFEVMCKTFCGTRGYMAPEVLAGEKYNPAKADAWSAGVCLFIMLSGSPPMRIANGSDWWFRAISLKRHDRFWEVHQRLVPDFPAGAITLLNRIFVADPKDRATLSEVLSDPWLMEGEISAKELVVVMRTLKGKSDAAEDALRKEELVKRQAELRKRRKDGGAAFDPFGKDTRRSALPSVQAPALSLRDAALPAAFGGFFIIDAYDAVKDLDKLHQAALGAAGVGGKASVNADRWEVIVEGGAPSPELHVDSLLDVDQDPPMNAPEAESGPAVVALRLYAAELYENPVLYVDARRLAGDMFAALRLLAGVQKAFGQVHEVASSDVDNTTRTEEPILMEEDDMI